MFRKQVCISVMRVCSLILICLVIKDIYKRFGHLLCAGRVLRAVRANISIFPCVCVGWIPETMEEWKLLLHLVQNKSTKPAPQKSPNGNFSDGPSPINVENVALLLAKAMGPDRAWSLLQECGLTLELSEKFTRTCDILRIAEKRQR